MEKYGVSQEDIAASDEQLREIKKLCAEAGQPYRMPKSAGEADRIIEKLASKKR